MFTRPRHILFMAVLLCLGVSSQAQTAIYTITGTGTGTLGASTFTNASFSITATADVSSIFLVVPGIYNVPDTTTTLSINGLGSSTFTDVIQTVSNQNNKRAGFGDNANNLALVFDDASAFATYDLTTSIGPISGTPSYNSFPQDVYATTAGNLRFSSITGNVTFQATVAAVPEPGSIALLAGMGLSGAGFLARHRKNARQTA